MNAFAEPYNFRAACEYLAAGKVVIFGAGLGIPYVSTDTAVVVRGAEIAADVILMAKNVDGVYTADPKKDPTARRYRKISYRQCVDDDLHAIDEAAALLAHDQGIDSCAFSLADPENILRAARGEEVGTLLTAADCEAELYPEA